MARRFVTAPPGRGPWRPSAQDKQRLLSFEGYGVDEPDIVFVGLEEYCNADAIKQRENIRVRCTSAAYAEARADKEATLEALAGLVKTDVPVWEMMAKILAALTGRDWTLERQALGRRPTTHSPTTWLTELRALPRPGTTFPWVGSYLQEWFSDEFRSQTDFETKSEALSGRRIYRELDRAKAPAITFFYGLPARHWAERHLSPLLRDDFSTEEACSVARTKQGTLLISTGFYDGRHAESAFREHQIPALTETIRRQLTDRAVAALSTPRSRRT